MNNDVESAHHGISSPTAQLSCDTLGLGRTSGQRGAEISAGIRAEFMPSPVTKALRRHVGQVTAKILLRIVPSCEQAGVNFLVVRAEVFAAIIKQLIAE